MKSNLHLENLPVTSLRRDRYKGVPATEDPYFSGTVFALLAVLEKKHPVMTDRRKREFSIDMPLIDLE